jgi:hypothetical protein
LRESLLTYHHESKKTNLDIFDPSYGAVKADLAFKVGKIISFTNNIP